MDKLKPTLDGLVKSLDGKASKSRDLRDEWNSKTREHLTTRNSYNGKVREHIAEVQRQKSIRDEANAVVREAKAVRAEKNNSVKQAKKNLHNLTGDTESNSNSGRRRDRRDRKETPMMLKNTLKRLEREFERGEHTGKNEDKVMNKMRMLQRKIRDLESAESNNSELKDARNALNIAIEEQEAAHQTVTTAADAAQDAHDQMIDISEEVDRLREQADAAQSEVRKAKREADSAHQSYIVSLRCLHSIQDILRAKKNLETGTVVDSTDDKSRVGVQDLMERLMDGDELSVDDLMALQRGG